MRGDRAAASDAGAATERPVRPDTGSAESRSVARRYSSPPSASSEALPPTAAVLVAVLRSTAKRSR